MAPETYRQQLARVARAMTEANHEAAVANDLSPQSRTAGVKIFVDGNLEKRFEKIQQQLAFVAAGFDQFDELIREYVRGCRSGPYDTGLTDSGRMLDWLATGRSLSPAQQDYIACQRARHAVEELARRQRLQHVRFQKLRSQSQSWLPERDLAEGLCLHLNPIREWAQFVSTELLDDEAQPPANVLFFADGNEVSTAVLELEGQALVNELADYQPCTLQEWMALSPHRDRDELAETCSDLAEMGLVAISASDTRHDTA